MRQWRLKIVGEEHPEILRDILPFVESLVRAAKFSDKITANHYVQGHTHNVAL
jgi:hypothetical protein